MPEGFKKYIIFTCWVYALPIAYQLQQEGKEVIVGYVDDMDAIGQGKEETEDHKIRTSNYGNLLDVRKAEKLIEQMEKFDDKEEWFVFCESNLVWEFSERAMKMGFTNGLLPTKFDFEIEGDRNKGKEFVKKFYPDIEVSEVMDFKTIEDGIEYVKGSEDFMALKANDAGGQTVVPTTEDIEFAREEITDALRNGKKSYEEKGFILEKQIRDGIELCPEMLYWDGEPVASSIDYENKSIGGANVGKKMGCMQNIVCATEMDAPINDIAFPKAMDRLAKIHKGLFIADINLIYKDGKFFYLEFCGNRPGYDSIYSEMDMAGGAGAYFDALSSKQKVYQRSHGVAIRGLNLSRNKEHRPQEDLSMRWKDEDIEHVWPFELRKRENDDSRVNVGLEEDVFVITESSDDPEYAVHKAYDILDRFSFKDMYVRSEEDFLSKEYPDSILNRMEAMKKYTAPVEAEKK